MCFCFIFGEGGVVKSVKVRGEGCCEWAEAGRGWKESCFTVWLTALLTQNTTTKVFVRQGKNFGELKRSRSSTV